MLVVLGEDIAVVENVVVFVVVGVQEGGEGTESGEVFLEIIFHFCGKEGKKMRCGCVRVWIEEGDR